MYFFSPSLQEVGKQKGGELAILVFVEEAAQGIKG